MFGLQIFPYKRQSLSLPIAICGLLLLLTAGCGGDAAQTGLAKEATDATRTGSASFSVEWHMDAMRAAVVPGNGITRYAIEDCGTAGIKEITCEVYDEANTPVASGGPWNCEDHHARMERIPEGSNLTFTILGWDKTDGNIIYQGVALEKVTISAGDTTNAGTIPAKPFVPTELMASATSPSQVELAWVDLETGSYRIYQNGTLLETTPSPSYSVTGLSPDTSYCYTVSAVDIFGNESGLSLEACATTGNEGDTLAPTTPSNIAAEVVSHNRIDLTWSASSDNVGVSGYWVSRNNGIPDMTQALSFSDVELEPETDYCYDVVAHDAAGNESAPANICAKTPASPDTDPPTTPIVQAVAVSGTRINLSWEPSEDNVGVTGYDIFRDEQRLDRVTTLAFWEAGLNPDTQYCYDVVAFDAAGNRSDPGSACATTPTAFTAVLASSFSVSLRDTNEPQLYGDAADQEGQLFNSNTLVLNRQYLERVCFEFDIANAPGSARATLTFEMLNRDDPQSSSIQLNGYPANGAVNVYDYDQTDGHQPIETFSGRTQSDWLTYSFDVTEIYSELKKMEQSYLGIWADPEKIPVSYDLRNPRLTITPEM